MLLDSITLSAGSLFNTQGYLITLEPDDAFYAKFERVDIYSGLYKNPAYSTITVNTVDVDEIIKNYDTNISPDITWGILGNVNQQALFLKALRDDVNTEDTYLTVYPSRYGYEVLSLVGDTIELSAVLYDQAYDEALLPDNKNSSIRNANKRVSLVANEITATDIEIEFNPSTTIYKKESVISVAISTPSINIPLSEIGVLDDDDAFSVDITIIDIATGQEFFVSVERDPSDTNLRYYGAESDEFHNNSDLITANYTSGVLSVTINDTAKHRIKGDIKKRIQYRNAVSSHTITNNITPANDDYGVTYPFESTKHLTITPSDPTRPLWLDVFNANLMLEPSSLNLGDIALKFDFVVTSDENGLSADFVETFNRVSYDLLNNATPSHGNIRYIPSGAYESLSATTPDTSAYDLELYPWVSVDQCQLSLVNDGSYALYSFTVELSSFNGFNRLENVVVELNKDQNVLTITDDFDFETNILNATVYSNAGLKSTYGGVWSVDNLENIQIFDIDGNEIIFDQVYEDQTEIAVISAIGFNFNVICLTFSSEEFVDPAEVCVYPNDAGIQNTVLDVDIIESDICSTPYSYLIDANFIEGDTVYNSPIFGEFIFDLTENEADLEVSLSSTSGIISFGDIVPAEVVSDGLYLIITPSETTDIPTTSRVSINALYTHNTDEYSYSSQSSETIDVREYPDQSFYYLSLGSIEDDRYTKDGWSTIVYSLSTPYTRTFTVSGENVSFDDTDVNWYVNDDFYSNGTTSISLDFSSTTDTISAVSVEVSGIEIDGYSCDYLFNEKMNLIIGEPILYDIIGFPRNNFVNGVREILTYDTALSARELTAFGCEHTETFLFSATEGFDIYHWNIANNLYVTDTNTFSIDIASNEALSSVSGSGYNELFPVEQSETIYNSYTYPYSIEFVDYLEGSTNIVFDDYLINLNKIENTRVFFTANADYTGTPNVFVDGLLTLTLSSPERIATSEYVITPTSNRKFFEFDMIDSNSDWFFRENTFEVYNVCFDLSANSTIPFEDWGICNTIFDTHCESLTVYNGPELALFSKYHSGLTGDNFELENATEVFSALDIIQYYKIDKGDGEILTLSGGDTTFNISYSAEGCYSIGMSAYDADDELAGSAMWNDFICVKESFDEYDPTANRSAFDILELPYDCLSYIKPNEYVTSTRINNWFESITDNIQYLIEKTRVVSSNAPWNYIGWVGKYVSGTPKWNYNRDYDSRLESDWFGEGVDLIYMEDYLIVVKPKSINIYTNTNAPELITEQTNVTEGEVFQNISAASFDTITNNLYVVDAFKNVVYILAFNQTDKKFDFVSYFGGLGNKSAKSKFNNPRDIALSDFYMFVADTDNKVVKIYNKFLSYVMSLDVGGNKPTSISTTPNYIFVGTEEGSVYIFSLENGFPLVTSRSGFGNISIIHGNVVDEGVYYIVSDDKIYKKTMNGVDVSSLTNPFNSNITAIAQNAREFYVLGKNIIHKFIDDYELFEIGDSSQYENLWDIESIKVSDDEYIQSPVYNDSISKIIDNINIVKNALHKQFVIYISEVDDTFVGNAVVDLDEVIVQCGKDFLFGVNERADSYETWHRVVKALCDCIESLKVLIDSNITRRRDCDNYCWTWKALRTDVAVAYNCSVNPVSWAEMKEISNIGLSAKAWEDMRSNTGDSIHPQCEYVPANRWQRLLTVEATSSGCLYALTWMNSMSGGGSPIQWIDCVDGDCITDEAVDFEDCLNLKDLC